MLEREYRDVSPAVGRLLQAMAPKRALPPGAVVIAELKRHPTHGWGCLCVRMASGAEVAWDGRSFRSLPRNWRELVQYTEVQP